MANVLVQQSTRSFPYERVLHLVPLICTHAGMMAATPNPAEMSSKLRRDFTARARGAEHEDDPFRLSSAHEHRDVIVIRRARDVSR